MRLSIRSWVPRSRGLRALALLSLGSILIGAGTTAFLSWGASGASPDPDTHANIARASATSTVVAGTPAATPVATPAVVLPPGGEPPAGGDQAVGPPASRIGIIPENIGIPADFMSLHDALQQEIDAYRASTGTEVSVAVTDLQYGKTISVRGNVAQRTGCTINMFALLTIASEFQAGRGDPATVASNVHIGIGASSPPYVRAFLDTVFGDFHAGEQRGRELMSSWGMSASLFDHVPFYGTTGQNNLLTTLETNMVLTKLYRGQLFDAQWTSYVLGVLHDIKPGLNYIIPGQLPAQASVAHKIGYYSDSDGWVVADAGIVTFTDVTGTQRAYAITYLSQQARTEYAGYSFGAHLSRVTWDWMYSRYHDVAPPAPTATNTPVPPTAVPSNTPRPPTRTPTPLVPTNTPFTTATSTATP